MRNKLTLQARVEAADGRPSGFDYMRILLSCAVLLVHAVSTGSGADLAAAFFYGNPFAYAVYLSILPMFFALSGFLVAGSLYRCRTLVSFLGLRVVRIYPALFVEVILTGLLIGPFVTSLSPLEYFTSQEFVRYLWNVSGHTTVFLPGAFEVNPLPNVANGQLWTVPWELVCYLALAFAVMVGGRRRREILLVALLLTLVGALIQHGVRSGWTFAPYEGRVAGRLLVIAFMAGVCMYAYREHIPTSNFHLLLAAAITIPLFSLTFTGQYAAVILAAYITCALGSMNPRRIWLLRHADLSYGIFLYHFIVQQTLMFFFPELRTWYWCLLVSLPLSVLVAALSWHIVEKPAMQRKAIVFKIEQLVVKQWEMRLLRSAS